MKDTSLTGRTKLLIVAGFAVALTLAAMVFGNGRNQPAAQGGSTAGRDARSDVFVAAASASMSGTTKLEFQTQPKQLVAGAPAIWMPKIFNAKTNEPVRSFETVRHHMMHLIVVSKDLSWFTHLFPEFKDRGLFITRTTLPRAGTYKLFADYTPRDGTREITQHEFSVHGNAALPAMPSLVADKPDKTGLITEMVSGEVPGDYKLSVTVPMYHVTLMPVPTKLVAGQPVKLRFQVREGKGDTIIDLQPYLGAMGYVVIISGDTNTYLPAEPMENGMADRQSGEPSVIFRTTFPKAGLYKIWAQFQHKNYVITAPFVLRVEADSSRDATG